MANIYKKKKAAKIKLRIDTHKGSVSAEDLWDFSLEELDEVVVGLDQQAQTSGKKSFLKPKRRVPEKIKLAFEVAKDVLETKMADLEAQKARAEKAAKREKILGIMAKKQDEQLSEASLDELESMLEDL
jgi:hypothetical protein